MTVLDHVPDVRPADLLLSEPRPLLVRRWLAKRFGLMEAVALQQLHWLLDHYDSRSVELDGRRWLKAELAFWCEQFPWASESTIRRVFSNLMSAGLVEKHRGRGGNTWTINYDAVDDLARTAQSDQSDGSHRPVGTVQSDQSPSIGEKREENNTGDDGSSPQLFETPSPQPQSTPDDRMDELVQRVWDHYVVRFEDRLRVKDLTPARFRTIRKALNAVGAENDPDAAVEICKAAIDGLQSYRTSHPGGTDISTIFSTGPHDKSNLTDKIEWWAEQAQGTLVQRDGRTEDSQAVPVDLAGVPPVTKGRINGERAHVRSMYAHPGSESVQERGQKALAWLRDHVGHEPIVEDGDLKGWRHV